MNRLLVLVLCVLFFAVGCAANTSAPGLATGGPALTTGKGSPADNKGTPPRISNLKIASSVPAGIFPLSFEFQDDEGDIESVVLTYSWDGGRESYSYPATSPNVVGKKSGTAEGKGYMGDSHYGRLNVSVAVKDRAGNKSNTLSKWITRR